MQRKIQGLVRGTITRLKAEGVDRSNAASLNAATQFSGPLLKLDNRARVHLYLELTELDAGSLARLNPTGQTQIEVVNEELKLVQAWVPFDEIELLAALDFVTRIRAPEYATYETGSVTTQGDAILKANTVRSTLAFTGAGVKVGVISDGANIASAAQGTGDLPSTITTFGTCNGAVTGTTCNEGTAMMEIIYDLAPGVSLGMGAAATSLEFIARVTDLRTWGAKVIVDDIGFLSQPYFEDGTVAAAYANALAAGIVMVSAAGNSAQSHYQAVYSNLAGSHNFGGGDITMNFSGPSGSTAVILLQWSNRFGAAADDYDLCVTNTSGTVVIACSAGDQTGTQDPFEAVSVSCSASSGCTGGIVIRLFSGAPQTVEMFIFGATATEYVVSADSIIGQAAVPGVMAVGAIRASDPGNTNIETYSSRGPSTIAFPAPQARATPTVTTVDCVTDTGAGGFPTNFCGTSAAAPHAAAVAALLLQANPNLVPSQVVSLMQSKAVERGAAGFDNTYGSGLVDALESVIASMGILPPAVSSLSPVSATRGGAAFTLTVNGLSFVASSVVRWNGSDRPTIFVGGGQLTAQIPASDLATAGAAQVTVFTPSPGGGTSIAVSFPINNPLPSLSSLLPTSTLVGGAAFVLTVNGANFVPESVVRWNTSNRTTTFVSASQLTAQIPTTDLTLARTVSITVLSPVPGGGTSTATTFTVSNPVPTLSTLFPRSVEAGATGFALTVNGTGFVSLSVVRWNGVNRATTFLNATQLFAVIPATDIATVGTAQVTVLTLAPGGGTSAAFPFAVTPPLPIPAFIAGGLVNGSSFAGSPAAGAIASLFGHNLAAAPALSNTLPLLTTLGGTSVRLNNTAVPLLFVGPDQINFVVPWELLGVSQATLTVTTAIGSNIPVTISLSNLSPGIFSTNGQGTGQGAILIAGTSVFAAPAGSIPGATARPVNRGEFITIYGTGLGDVSNRPASGAAAGGNSQTTATPTVLIGGVPATVSFSGLAPGFVGLYQINVPVPDTVATGDAISVLLSIGGVSANTLTIAVR